MDKLGDTTKEDMIKLMKFIYKIDSLGAMNIMIRNAMDTEDRELNLYKPKEWRNYIREHIDIVTEQIDYLNFKRKAK